MMMIRQTALLLLLICATAIKASTVSISDARLAATHFISLKGMPGELALDQAITMYSGPEATLYVFTLAPAGFIIMSADDRVMPVLGYSFESSYITSGQPENFSHWLEGYINLVNYSRLNNRSVPFDARTKWQNLIQGTQTDATASATVGPLLTCTWNQDYPYNSECPEDPAGSGGHVYSGCVATAMAQVLYYYRFPLQGTGSHAYTWDPYGLLSADFGATTYNWEEMSNTAAGSIFENARLQSHLGISVDMMYSPSGSGAYSQDAAEALKTYFGYNSSLQLLYMDSYSYEDWKSILRSNLDQGHPMYYHGFGSGGHAFNVDGYQDTAYFHFNWGWGGSFNGYFHLFNLDPGGSNFSYGQGAIVNFYPGDGYPYYCNSVETITTMHGSLEDGSGPNAPYLANASCGWLIALDDSIESVKLTFHRFDTEEGHDFVNVYDGPDSGSPLIGSFTGSALPPVVIGSGNRMFVQFVTDSQNASQGWFATYEAKVAEFCSGTTYMTEPTGSANDGSGTYNYHGNSLCKYRIMPEDAQSITLTFDQFDTYDGSDFINIVDMSSGKLLYKLFGPENPGTFSIPSGNIMLIFKTDDRNHAQGWSFHYTSSNLPVTSIHESLPALRVYPVPANRYLFIETGIPLKKGAELTLLNNMGQTVLKECSPFHEGDRLTLDVSEIQAGIYSLRLNSEGYSTGTKVIITH